MDPKGFLLDEDRGVSPVIGVILMVAITVILAAVIATFVMNMGPTETTMPNAQWNFNEDEGASEVTIEHNGGSPVKADNVQIKVSDGSGGGGSTDLSSVSPYGSGSELTAGSDLVVGFSGSSSVDIQESSISFSDGEIQIIWENPDSGETQIMAEWEA
ncbi:Protein of unknown function DUF1628 [Halorhabdus utahensis DSM 12940]|uniref:Archaeal Type IV pilin N-terminal domain-containing protein n=1 Tax=Halorhabdus utahensis (strain DSM 12940 / JCM 11049 / AX-2) TaxID=519442 RepID=C7NU79_HALUD|nr:type IV pilin N-terminal domain-containing protein [Halorhabdus utahensis]ACV10976.1 Protein of unknown function DUF1628 [Halorhabdus utahensis DSM 12940]